MILFDLLNVISEKEDIKIIIESEQTNFTCLVKGKVKSFYKLNECEINSHLFNEVEDLLIRDDHLIIILEA